MLARGGSAVDAMVAANAALGVVYPHMSGVGGDAFWLIHDAASGRQHVLNASGRAAAAATRELYAGAFEIAPRGPRAALTVPGAVDGWAHAHARFGGWRSPTACGPRSASPATGSRSPTRPPGTRPSAATCSPPRRRRRRRT